MSALSQRDRVALLESISCAAAAETAEAIHVLQEQSSSRQLYQSLTHRYSQLLDHAG